LPSTSCRYSYGGEAATPQLAEAGAKHVVNDECDDGDRQAGFIDEEFITSGYASSQRAIQHHQLRRALSASWVVPKERFRGTGHDSKMWVVGQNASHPKIDTYIYITVTVKPKLDRGYM